MVLPNNPARQGPYRILISVLYRQFKYLKFTEPEVKCLAIFHNTHWPV
jgi:hypothetical protein